MNFRLSIMKSWIFSYRKSAGWNLLAMERQTVLELTIVELLGQINNAAVGAFEYDKELAVRDIKTNYFGTKNLTEKLLPLLKHSDAGARVVILSSLHGQLSVHGDYSEEVGAKIERPVGDDAEPAESVPVPGT